MTPEPPPQIGVSNYPRHVQPSSAAPATRLPGWLRCARGFVIGNYWFAGLAAFLIGVYFLAGAPQETHPHHSFDGSGLLIVPIFFAGFAIGAITKRQRVSIILAGLTAPLAWIVWGAGVIQMDSNPGFLILFPYTAVNIALAVLVNQASKRARGLNAPFVA